MKCVYDESKECEYLDCSMNCFMKEEIYQAIYGEELF